MRKSLLSAVALTAVMAFSSSAWAEVVIAVAGPITGPNAAFGAQLQKGAEQAAADINAAGGMNGEQIRIVIGGVEQGGKPRREERDKEPETPKKGSNVLDRLGY